MKVPISPWNTPTPQALRDHGGVSTPAQVRVSHLFMTFNKTQTSPHWRLIKESIGSEHSEALTLRDCDQGVGMRTGTQGQQGQAPRMPRARAGWRKAHRGGRPWGDAAEGQGQTEAEKGKTGQPKGEQQRRALGEDRLGKRQTEGQTWGQSEEKTERGTSTEPKRREGGLQCSTCNSPGRQRPHTVLCPQFGEDTGQICVGDMDGRMDGQGTESGQEGWLVSGGCTVGRRVAGPTATRDGEVFAERTDTWVSGFLGGW